jgi:hypothetical protein
VKLEEEALNKLIIRGTENNSYEIMKKKVDELLKIFGRLGI